MSLDKGRESRPHFQEVSDPRALRALAHPVRIALLEVVSEEPLTATEAGELIGESPSTCSFHLRQLAKYGFVEEAGGGRGRRRPWRKTHGGMHFTEVHDDPETARAAAMLDRVLRQRYFARLQAWLEIRHTYPKKWRQVTGGSQFLLYLTPAELEALNERLLELVAPYQPRLTEPDRRPKSALPIELLAFAYPVDRIRPTPRRRG
jgi:DNA-binding transcriptional ArsR family regulator